jgi:hypothetical protein
MKSKTRSAANLKTGHSQIPVKDEIWPRALTLGEKRNFCGDSESTTHKKTNRSMGKNQSAEQEICWNVRTRKKKTESVPS